MLEKYLEFLKMAFEKLTTLNSSDASMFDYFQTVECELIVILIGAGYLLAILCMVLAPYFGTKMIKNAVYKKSGWKEFIDKIKEVQLMLFSVSNELENLLGGLHFPEDKNFKILSTKKQMESKKIITKLAEYTKRESSSFINFEDSENIDYFSVSWVGKKCRNISRYSSKSNFFDLSDSDFFDLNAEDKKYIPDEVLDIESYNKKKLLPYRSLKSMQNRYWISLVLAEAIFWIAYIVLLIPLILLMF